MGRFDGKIALITGGTSGIGLAVARQLAGEGARVYVTGRRGEAGQRAVEEAGRDQLELRFVQSDVADPNGSVGLLRRIREEAGRLDVVVMSHGTLGRPAPVVEQTLEDFRAAVDINLTGTFLVAKHALPLMGEGGSVVIVGSTVGSGVTFPGTSAYAASKAALTAFAETLALEVAPQGIRVNVLVPGGVDTPMFRSTMGATPESAAHIASLHALGRVAEPAELAKAAAFLASGEASFVTGTTLAVDGGMRVL